LWEGRETNRVGVGRAKRAGRPRGGGQQDDKLPSPPSLLRTDSISSSSVRCVSRSRRIASSVSSCRWTSPRSSRWCRRRAMRALCTSAARSTSLPELSLSLPTCRVALPPGCQIGCLYQQQGVVTIGCFGPMGCRSHSRGVWGDWLYGHHTGCHQLVSCLTHNNDVKSVNPTVAVAIVIAVAVASTPTPARCSPRPASSRCRGAVKIVLRRKVRFIIIGLEAAAGCPRRARAAAAQGVVPRLVVPPHAARRRQCVRGCV
jgi:hypothetical protein